MDQLMSEALSISEAVRYVAVYKDGCLASRERPGLAGASCSESDRYEELLVNPTLLKLATQRGNIDCGGLEYILIRYGHFFQFVQPIGEGHISVAIEKDADPLTLLGRIRAILRRHDLLAEVAPGGS